MDLDWEKPLYLVNPHNDSEGNSRFEVKVIGVTKQGFYEVEWPTETKGGTQTGIFSIDGSYLSFTCKWYLTNNPYVYELKLEN